MGEALAPPPRSSFARYWTAAAISSFGSAVTAVAMPVLVVQLLAATPFEVGVVNAAQFVPYALLGLIAGVYTDSHSGPCPEDVWRLLEEIMPRTPNLKGVTFEFHDSYFPQFGAEGVRTELARARAIWTQHRAR